MKRLRPIFLACAGIIGAVFLFFSWRNSTVVTQVSIRLKSGVKEHLDHSLLKIGEAHRLPDYKVKLRVTRKFLALDLGTKLDTSATNWIAFPVAEVVPARHLQEILIVEDDKIESDLLERIQPIDGKLEGSSFDIQLTTERSFEAGLNWFFNTPPGKALSVGIVIAVVLILLSLF